jgi:hypothetical protein
VRPSLFREAPAPRGFPLPPKQRDPLEVALLCLLPFYGLYWVYRAHGEVTALAPSRSMLSPVGSLVAGLLVPLILPVMMVSLIDALKSRLSESEAAASRWVLLWAILLPPVAAALVQSAMNEAVSRTRPSIAVT